MQIKSEFNNRKIKGLFDVEDLMDKDIHVLGVGAVNGFTGETLAKLGVKKVHIWDFDIVEDKNNCNQIYNLSHVGMKKVDALKQIMLLCNPTMEVILHDRYNGEQLNGIVFLGVDKISVRRDFADGNQYNKFLEFVLDTRVSITSGQIHVINWEDEERVQSYVDYLYSFSDEDVVPEMVDTCGGELGTLPSPRISSALAVQEFVNFTKHGQPKINTISYDLGSVDPETKKRKYKIGQI